jgi:hypothetical protein
MQKVSRKGGNGNQSGQTPSGSSDPLRRLSHRRFCDAVWGCRRVKLPSGKKDLKTVKSGDLKTKGRPLPPKNVSPPLLREFR